MARVAPDDGPVAFDVHLGMPNVSRTSEIHVVKVNSDSKVEWLFRQGAFLFRSIHKRDLTCFLKDFDIFLKREESHEISLNPSREIADYAIKKNDELQFRHKALPISVFVDVCDEEQKMIEVNSGYQVKDIVPTICKQFGIKNTEELSIARVERNKDKQATQYQWLDQQNSLNGQGINDGDTLLLRKKFFILNDDVEEALDGKTVLRELICNQTLDMFAHNDYIGGALEEGVLVRMCCLLHRIEQKQEQRHEDISDEFTANRIIPKCHQQNEYLRSQIAAAYTQESVALLSKEEAKKRLLELLVHPQSILVTYYPVKLLEDSTEYILVGDSSAIALHTEQNQSLQPVEGKIWRVRDIRGTDCTQKQQLVSVNALGSWQAFSTSYASEIASYVKESRILMSKRTAHNRPSNRATPIPELIVQILPLRSTILPEAKQIEHLVMTEPCTSPALSEESATAEILPSSLSSTPTTAHVSSIICPSPLTPDVVKIPSEPPSPLTPDVVKIPSEPPSPLTPDVVKIPSKPEIKPINQNPVQNKDKNKEKKKEKEEEKRPLTPDVDASLPVHIPEYFGLDYREVLKDYKLFYIVTANKDKRSLLLNTVKPVKKVIEDSCAIFGIPHSPQYHFWLPRGKENIIKKYGGKPKKIIGKFIPRKPTNAPQCRLDQHKTLAEQYNFNIKPLVLHLHKHHPEEHTDAADEVDAGREWPTHENSDIKSYRQFYQGWCGVVQGAYPVEKDVAVKLAALLTHIYYGDRALYKVWPLEGYDTKVFLPDTYCKSFGIASEVEKVYTRLSGMTIQECIKEASSCCSEIVTHQGVFFDVSVPEKSDIMAVIKWNKMKPRLFGISSHGIFSVDKETGKILFTHRFSDICNWNYGENTFKLNFSQWSPDYHAYTYQTEEILDTLQLHIDMTRNGVISQAPSRPVSTATEQEQPQSKTGTPVSLDISFSHKSSNPETSTNTTPRRSPQLDESRRHEPAVGTEDAGIGRTSPPIQGEGDKDKTEELHSSLDLSDMEGVVLQATI